jgi:type II secretory pathway pseudopilin PulG
MAATTRSRTLRSRLRPGGAAAFTVVELLIAVAIMAMLLAAVAVAMQGVLQCYGENGKIADVTQAARVVLHRMTMEIRTANEASTSSTRISIIPADPAVSEIVYELINGTLYRRQTVSGVTSSSELISAGGQVQVTSLNLSKVNGVDGHGVSYTKSVTVKLTLRVDNSTLPVTASASLRRNMDY